MALSMDSEETAAAAASAASGGIAAARIPADEDERAFVPRPYTLPSPATWVLVAVVMGAFFDDGIPRPVCAAPAGVVLVLGATATQGEHNNAPPLVFISSTCARACVCVTARGSNVYGWVERASEE